MLKKKHDKNNLEKESARISEKKKKEMEAIKNQEDAFLTQEAEAMKKEQNDQMKTKRLIDNMMCTNAGHSNEEICQLLSNYKGIILFLMHMWTY